ncbi:MAG: hypothetical protein WCL14_01670 [Bacteroidota bacterium]
MNRLEFKTKVHDGIIEIPESIPEIKNKEVNVVIMWDEKPVDASRRKKTTPVAEKELNKLQKIYEVIDAGADISSFGDLKDWQKTTRKDRNMNQHGL